MSIFKRFLQPKSKQRTFVYCPHCPHCKHEMVGSNSLVRDVYVRGTNVVHYKCTKCSFNSYWNFDHPVIFQVDNDTAFAYKKKFKL